MFEQMVFGGLCHFFMEACQNDINFIACWLLFSLFFIQQSMRKETFDVVDDKILRSFQIIKKVGQGAYGQVWKAKDKKTSNFCALKKIYDAFRNSTDAQRAYRQIKYLQRLNHPNIIKILSFYKPENTQDIYLALQFIEADLSTAIKDNVLKQIHKHFIFFQIANAVHYLHSAQLIHRDIKPSNILVTENCEVKMCDFGLIRSLVPDKGQFKVILTENIATRWYRAPQILLCSNNYGKQIDIWSLGCVLAEIFLGKPIFQGTSAITQLERIFQVTGKPTREQLDFVRSEASRSIVQSMTVSKKISFTQIFPRAEKHFIDLLDKIFQINPKNRITIDELILHPFVNRFKSKAQLFRATSPIKIMYESQHLAPEDYRQLLYNQIQQKPFPADLPTGKTSQLSTFYQSSITHSLPNNSRQQFFKNNCPLGRADRFSPPKQLQTKFTSAFPNFQHEKDVIKHQTETISKIVLKKPQTCINKAQTKPANLHFPFDSRNNMNIKHSKAGEKYVGLNVSEIKKTFTPIKFKVDLPVKHHSNQKNTSNRHFQSPQQKTSLLKFQLPFFKNKNDKDSLPYQVRPKRGSPSPSSIKQEVRANFNPNHTIGGKFWLKKEKIAPRFILQGRKKFRSGSPKQIMPNKSHNQITLKKPSFLLHTEASSASFTKPNKICNIEPRYNLQYNNNFASPQHRPNTRYQFQGFK